MSNLPLSIRVGAARNAASGPKVTLKLTLEQRMQIANAVGRLPDQIELSVQELNDRAGWRQMNKAE